MIRVPGVSCKDALHCQLLKLNEVGRFGSEDKTGVKTPVSDKKYDASQNKGRSQVSYYLHLPVAPITSNYCDQNHLRRST